MSCSRRDLTYPDPSTDVATDGWPETTGTKSHVLLNVDTGETRVLKSYSSDERNLDLLDACVVDGQYYTLTGSPGPSARWIPTPARNT